MLNAPDENGTTKAQHLRQVAKATGKEIAWEPETAFPDPLLHLRDAFLLLRQSAGDRPIGYPDLESYARVNRIQFDPYEVDVLMALESAFQSELADLRAQRQRSRHG